MAGLPHFSNSIASMNNFEPVYLNQFEVVINPPASVAGGPILLQHVTKVTGMDVDKNPAPVAQKYKFAKRNIEVPLKTTNLICSCSIRSSHVNIIISSIKRNRLFNCSSNCMSRSITMSKYLVPLIFCDICYCCICSRII